MPLLRVRRLVAVAAAACGLAACGLDVVGTAPGSASTSPPPEAGVPVPPPTPTALDQDGAADAGCLAPAPGLVGWWPADGTMLDISGSGLNGAAGNKADAGPVTYTDAGFVGRAFALEGKSFVAVPDGPLLHLTNVTLETWVYAHTANGRFLDHHHALSTNGYMLDAFNGNLRLVIGPNILTGPPVEKERWIHVAGTYDGREQRLYVDGELVATQAADSGIPPNTEAFRIGADSDGAERFDGLIDEPSLYKRALTAEEIRAVFAAGRAGKCRPGSAS